MDKRIYYHDTDSGGVVYYANYLKYLEEARTEYLDQRGLSVTSFHEQGMVYAVRKCTIQYRAPARYGDILSCTAKIVRITAAQLIFQQQVLLKNSGQLLVDAEVILVCLNQDFKPTPIPDDLRARLQ